MTLFRSNGVGVSTALEDFLKTAENAVQMGSSAGYKNNFSLGTFLARNTEDEDGKHTVEGQYQSAGQLYSSDANNIRINGKLICSKVSPPMENKWLPSSVREHSHRSVSGQDNTDVIQSFSHAKEKSRRCNYGVNDSVEIVPSNTTDEGYDAHTYTVQKDDANSSQIIELRGELMEMPSACVCHRCHGTMKLSLRRTNSKGSFKHYHAYRCIRKGCQTFLSVNKIVDSLHRKPARPENSNRKREKRVDSFGTEAEHKEQKYSAPLSTFSETQPPSTTEEMARPAVMGTLLYIPFTMSQEEVMALQQAAVDIVAGLHGSHETTSAALCSFSSEELKAKMASPDGQMNIRNLLSSNRNDCGGQGNIASFTSSFDAPAASSAISPVSMTNIGEDPYCLNTSEEEMIVMEESPGGSHYTGTHDQWAY